LGEPKRSEVQKLYHSHDLTILNVIWGPRMTVMPHGHRRRSPPDLHLYSHPACRDVCDLVAIGG
jgi:hypothetical protein